LAEALVGGDFDVRTEDGAEKVFAALAIPSVAKATPHIIRLVARLKSRPFQAITFQHPLKPGPISEARDGCLTDM
jgi:hypothetical protein